MTATTLTQVPPRSTPVLEGKIFIQPWSGWFRNLYNVLKPGITVTVTLAKLTTGGTNGSITIANGVVTNYVAPT